ncbi:delta3,5-delta2,4-dienoyl-CoA isomerase [Ochromonadaceae sp. CCMP2298]|nr:delta3,5-delta2,4-dienoyl-CoA isomerase [Ochromonadaceae sp. CCMP2298]
MEQYTNVVRDLFDGVIPDLASGTPPASTTATATTTAPKVPVSVSSIAFPAQQARLSLADLDLKTITVALAAGVQQVNLARPKRGNAFNMQMWDEYQQVFHALQADPHARVVVLSGLGGNFSTGMDLSVFAEMQQMAMKEKCEGRRREGLSRFIQFLQDCVSLPEQCALPVIAAVSGHCIGGAIDVITACDLRYCTKDASFSIKETDLAIVADIGTLQRIPKIIGHQRAAELTYTGRTFSGAEAEKMGLVAGCFDSEAEMMAHVNAVAAEIASKSPLTTRGVKRVLLHSREHTTTQGLEYVKMWNSAYLLSDDLMEAMRAAMAKEKPTYPRS